MRKRHFLVDGPGVPLSLVLTGVNAHDETQAEATLTNIIASASPCICALMLATEGRRHEDHPVHLACSWSKSELLR